jgi:anti-sigma B factor antagonist
MSTSAGFRCGGERLGDGTALVTVAGELDIGTADHLRTQLAELRTQGDIERLVVDLSDVTFIDSSGMGVLVGAQRLAIEPLRVVAPEGAVLRALTLASLTKIFRVSASRSEALVGAAPSR